MNTILITGASGQLGQEFLQLSQTNPYFHFLFAHSKDLDITHQSEVTHFFKKHDFHCCVNCAAFTVVDKAESEPEVAYKVNAEGAKNIAEACRLKGIPLIHLSTDYVYDNDQNTPFKEGDPTNPQSIYAKSKLKGDELALKAHPGTMIIRTSWVYSSFGNNFVKTILRLAEEPKELSVIFDQIGTPTYARDIATAILTILQKFENREVGRAKMRGIYHFSDEGVASWYDFAKAIFEIENIPCQLKPIETKDYPTPAKRPPFSVLNKAKIKETFGLEIPHWRDSLRECLELLSAERKI